MTLLIADASLHATDIIEWGTTSLTEILQIERFTIDEDVASESIAGLETCHLRLHDHKTIIAEIADMADPAGCPVERDFVADDEVLVHVKMLAEDRITGRGIALWLMLAETTEIGVAQEQRQGVEGTGAGSLVGLHFAPQALECGGTEQFMRAGVNHIDQKVEVCLCYHLTMNRLFHCHAQSLIPLCLLAGICCFFVLFSHEGRDW